MEVQDHACSGKFDSFQYGKYLKKESTVYLVLEQYQWDESVFFHYEFWKGVGAGGEFFYFNLPLFCWNGLINKLWNRAVALYPLLLFRTKSKTSLSMLSNFWNFCQCIKFGCFCNFWFFVYIGFLCLIFCRISVVQALSVGRIVVCLVFVYNKWRNTIYIRYKVLIYIIDVITIVKHWFIPVYIQ